MTALFARFRDRIESKGAEHGLVYPWWIPVLSTAGLVGGAIGGALQRVDHASLAVLVLAVALVDGPCLAHFLVRPWLPWWCELTCVTAGTALLLTTPFPGDGRIDLAPFALAFLVGEVTAAEGWRRGVASVTTSTAVLLLVGDYTSDHDSLFISVLVVGLVFGLMLRWQMRALAAEHAAREEEHVRATLAERQRVAREIHDLVAHSLSVTMLHVTGARRALQQDADVPDAIEALTEAERIGRQAMADIRRTVSVLATEESDDRPLPGAADLDDLVAGFRSAGLDVDWTHDGDLGALSPAAGLGVYRLVQESLANVVKHAPGAPAAVRLVVDDAAVRLSVTNPVLAGASVGPGGSGLTGMASRVDQLGGGITVGPDGERWRVDLALPLAENGGGHQCVIRRMLP